MADLLPPELSWHCFQYLEWTTIAQIWDNSGVGHNIVPDFLMTIIADTTGIGYGSDRFNQLMETYGWELVNTPVPPPLDWVWTTSKPMWFEIGAIYDAEGDADWNLCRVLTGEWALGAGWPSPLP